MQGLIHVDNYEVQTQVNVFNEHKDEDAEEFIHRYDDIRLNMEYPFDEVFVQLWPMVCH